ncbi:Por secretion system C-terminal sorting domain-containing protein [Pseudarcicella hirudinis]|uniref:Por secretion system C-terminal sorting domain-containing protein n=2 Tax=Pseudarcicella hirudinis TaxID=1079859 RepID=A0A1I5YCP4_9BACT|nr:Por secretion system C-terminal sorting domain-containing protein [Pseudarcicella hirudinis]
MFFLFIMNLDATGQCNIADYKGLRALYNSTNGDNWNNKDNWDVRSENPPQNCNLSKFHGVYLDASGRVYLINLGENNLNGQIPKEIQNLTNLTTLWLNQNNLIGEIPKELGSLIKLERLALSYNNLSGTIPVEFYNLINLKEISIESNKLAGSLGNGFKNFPKLERLLVNSNNFSGLLPAEIGKLINLKEITFHNNNFEGCFPITFKSLCDKNINFNNNLKLADWGIFCKESICKFLNAESSFLCNLDKSKMIPLRDSQRFPYVVKLKGSAINLNSPYEIHFDTGSWTTSIPGGLLNLNKVKILKENINDPWGNLADLVSGQFILESVDGTPYELNDYVFYATKDKTTKKYLPDASTGFTTSILGAFPSIDPDTRLPSVPFALALKYAPDNMGLGIISDCYEDINKNWNSMKSYLQIGNDSKILDKLNFRTDIPNWRNQQEFHPEAVPGFSIKIKFSDTDEIIEASNLISTVDTGASELTLRLDSDNPQNKATFSSHFIKDGLWVNWNNTDYNNSAKTLINADVTIEFTDSNGAKNSYSFPIDKNPYSTPTTLYACTWEGNAPWKESFPQFPKNRINLGNTIYFYCPIYFWDIKNKRVGIGFKNQCQLNAKINTPDGTSFCTGSSVNISAEPMGNNNPFTYKWKQGTNDLGTTTTLTVAKAGTYTLEVTDKEGCIITKSIEIMQSSLPNVTISKSGSTDLFTGGSIILSVPSGAEQTYQWFKNNLAILGAINNSFTVNEAGKFSVTVTANGCSATSETVTVNVILANELPNESKTFKVFPNPVENTIKTIFNEPLTKPSKVNLINQTGIVLKEWITNLQENSFDILGLPSGIYILKCEINDKIEEVKLIKN